MAYSRLFSISVNIISDQARFYIRDNVLLNEERLELKPGDVVIIYLILPPGQIRDYGFRELEYGKSIDARYAMANSIMRYYCQGLLLKTGS